MDKARQARFHCRGGVSLQNRAMSVCSAVRLLPTPAPSILISLQCGAHSCLPRLNGPARRNCEADFSANGSTNGVSGAWAARNAGGVGTQTPGPELGT